MEHIEIYLADTTTLSDSALFERLLKRASKDRRERILAQKREADRRLSLAAELLLSHALMLHGITSYTVERDEYGKPRLSGENTLCFNLSHSGERAMCVLSDRAVGCDVQWMNPVIRPALAERFFSASECELLRGELTEEGRRELFYRLWTLRESFVKATGEGVLRRFESFSVIPVGEEYQISGIPSDAPSHFFEPLSEAQYRYALCGEREKIAPVVWVRFDVP